MSEGLRISLGISEVRDLFIAQKGYLEELEAWEEADVQADPLDALVVGRLRSRFWHAHGGLSGVCDALESLYGEAQKLQDQSAAEAARVGKDR